MLTDPDGRIVPLLGLVIGAAIVYGVGNVIAKASAGEINSIGDGLKAFAVGAVVGATTALLAQVPIIGAIISVSQALKAVSFTANAAVGLGRGIVEGNWQPLGNTFRIHFGDYYTDGNLDFHEEVWMGISRHTWEAPQNAIGYTYSQFNNGFGNKNVHLIAGATVVNHDDTTLGGWGVTIGNYINGRNVRPFDPATGNLNQLFMHEYGHTIQGSRFGLFYLPVVGLQSIISAANATPINVFNPYLGRNEDYNTHEIKWYERQASMFGRQYFSKYYGGRGVWNERLIPSWVD